MTDTRPDHEQIADAFEPAVQILGRLPDITEAREAKRLLDISADLAHQAREKVGPPTADET